MRNADLILIAGVGLLAFALLKKSKPAQAAGASGVPVPRLFTPPDAPLPGQAGWSWDSLSLGRL